MPVLQVSCFHSSANRWEHLYSEARQEFEHGDLRAALNIADQGFGDSISDPLWNFKFRVLKAEILSWQTHNTEVLSLLDTPPPPELSTGEFAVRAKATKGMALALLRNDEEGEKLLKEANELAVRTAPDLRSLVILYEGTQAKKKQQYVLAEQRFRESLQLAEQYHQPFIKVAALGSLATTTTNLGRFDESAEWYRKSIALSHSSQYRLTEYISVGNSAWNYQQLGDMEKAISLFDEAKKGLENLDQEQVKELLSMNLGETYFYQGKYAAAAESYSTALNMLLQMQSKKMSDETFPIKKALNNLATVALETGQLDKAEDYSRRAAALDPRLPETVLTSARIAAARHKLPEAALLLRCLIEPNQGKETVIWDKEAELDNRFIRWDAEAELAEVYAAQHQKVHAEHQFEALIKQVEDARSSLRVDENRLAFSFHAGRYYDDYVGYLVATSQRRLAFQVTEFSRARTLAEGVGLKAPKRPTDIKIDGIQSFLRRNRKIILSYWLAPAKSFLWLIAPSGFEFFTLARGSEIERKTLAYNATVQRARTAAELEEEGQALYQMLVGPAEKFISRGSQLVIIPDGALDKLNFETLRVTLPQPHYWIKDVETEVASSASLLINPRKNAQHPDRGMLLIGNPVEASKDYPALTHAGEEMERIKAQFPQHEVAVSGEKATPSSYISNHPANFAFIHFATHGTASELSPLESAIILSADAENSFKLYARDIVKTHIQADMVTISACYGAGTRAYAGEGLVGLAWAFLKAGAHQVVAGLWEVDDRVAVNLMDDFYTAVQKQTPANIALRTAKLKLVDSDTTYSRPYYWASLQLYTGS